MARFRFKAVAPSSEVVEGELEASDRQAAIGRLRELNHLPVRVEEMRDSPLRRRERPERIEPVMAEPPRIEAGRPEPLLAPRVEAGRPEPEPAPRAEEERLEPLLTPRVEAERPEARPAPRMPIVRLREVLRGTVGLARGKPAVVARKFQPAPEPPVTDAAPPAPLPPEPQLEPTPELPPEAIAPPWQEVAAAPTPEAAMPDAAWDAEPGSAEPPAAAEAAAEEEPVAPPAEAPTEPYAEQPAAPVEEPPSAVPPEYPPEYPAEPVEPSPADAADHAALDRQDEPYPPVHREAAAPDEPLPMQWDVTPSEPTPVAASLAPAGASPDDSSAGRWLAEVERSTEQHTEPSVVDSEEPPPEPFPEPSRAVVPASVTLPPVPFSDIAAEREREPERTEMPPPAREKRKPKPKRARRALPSRLLPVFTRELQVLLSAGLPMDQALRIIVESTADDRVAAAADALLARVRGGALLSEAMETLPEQFDEFLRTAVRAGEAGGSLAEVLDQVAAYQERGQKLERSVKTALIYPMILAFAAAFSVTLLLTLVVPQFEALLRQSAQAPPLATRLVIAASIYLREYGWIAPAGGLVLWLLARLRYRGPRNRAKLHARLLRLPLIGKVLAGVSVERLARALGTLLANGVPLPEALPLVANAVPNRAIGAITAAAAERVKQGERLADALEEGRVLPSLAVQLIRVGEEGGRLSEMLARIAEIYAGDVDVAVRRVTAVIEPALILMIGVVVGGIVLSLLAAITGLNTLAL